MNRCGLRRASAANVRCRQRKGTVLVDRASGLTLGNLRGVLRLSLHSLAAVQIHFAVWVETDGVRIRGGPSQRAVVVGDDFWSADLAIVQFRRIGGQSRVNFRINVDCLRAGNFSAGASRRSV